MIWISFDPKFFEAAVRNSLDNIWPRRVVSIMLSLVKLTNAHTVRGRPTLKNNTECFRNGLVREHKEKQRKLVRHSMTVNTHGPHGRNEKIGVSGVYV